MTRWHVVLDAAAPVLLGLAMLLYIIIVFAASKWQLDGLHMGFDPLVYEQPLWNTLHGHIAEQSALSYTTSAFGQDLFLFHFVLLPLYALKETTATLLFLQTVGAAFGALAVYLIARDALPRTRIVPFLFGALLLSYVPMQNVNLYEVQPRLFAATFLLFAYWCMTRGYAIGFWVCIVLAIINRNDTALVVAALGLYGILTRRRASFSWAPMLFGAVYWLLAVFVIIPAIAGGAQFSYLQNYDWLGATAGDIVKTIVTHPLFVGRTVFGPDRWEYPVSLLFALAFVPLLAPRPLLMALPPFLINIFAGDHYRYQRDIFHQYSALITPWLFVAAILAVAALADGTHPLYGLVPRVKHRLERIPAAAISGGLVIVMLALSAFQFAYTKPDKLASWAEQGGRLSQADKNRVASADLLIAMIPQDAPLAVTSLLATRVPLRRDLYEFPGNEFYNPALIDRAQYVLGDRRRDNGTEGAALDKLTANGQWQLIKRQGDFELLHRIAPPPGQTG
ncbi:MAG: DUF2079 domain-containing protein [Thermomicrobia bacterium]|nr:DUF2079 domain-containing protein [Thermomicrobia bacterium]MCA1723419.1 DUF2079 domain-containing protein [Thermomicrobia bacterium]